MAILRFSFSGESINAGRLQALKRKFIIEPDGEPDLCNTVPFPLQYFFAVSEYAGHFSEAFHLAASEEGVGVSRLELDIEGALDAGSPAVKGYIRIGLSVVADGSQESLTRVLSLARSLNPLHAAIDGVQPVFSMEFAAVPAAVLA